MLTGTRPFGGERIVFQHLHSALPQPVEQRRRRLGRAPCVIDQVDLDPALVRRKQHVGELATRLIVELVALHIDAGLGAADCVGQCGERRRAIDQQLDLVARQERHVREAFALDAHQLQAARRVGASLLGEQVRVDAGRRLGRAAGQRQYHRQDCDHYSHNYHNADRA